MKVIDAFWEKRNLGVSCTEIKIDTKDKLNDIKNILANCDSEYIVCKMPFNHFGFNHLLTNQGFTFMESSIKLDLAVKNTLLTPLQERINNEIYYDLMNNYDLDLLYNEIRGGLFKTDRIFLDPNFMNNQAYERYVNWIKDEKLNQSQIFKIIYKNETVGFFTLKQIDKSTYYPFLAGLYNKYSSSGLGFTALRKPIEEVIRVGGKNISTYVSSNNLPIVNIHLQLGFVFRSLEYVYIKHKKK